MNRESIPLTENLFDITVVVSCYNEEKLITGTLDNAIAALQEIGCTFEIIVVDDNSKDNSVQVVRDYIEKHPSLEIVLKENKVNRGLGNNYVEAAFIGRGKYYRLCCGDDGEPKEVLVNLFRHIGEADMIIPFNDRDVMGKTPGRVILSKTFTLLVNLLSGYRIKYYNGLSIHLRYNVLRWHPRGYGFGFQADLITQLLDEGFSFTQIPSYSIDKKGSASTALTIRNCLSVMHTLMEIAIRRLRKSIYGAGMREPVEVIQPVRKA